MNPFQSLPNEPAEVEKSDGRIAGPYKMIFSGSTIIVPDENADIDEGDVLVRQLPGGKKERFTVTESTFFRAVGGGTASFPDKA